MLVVHAISSLCAPAVTAAPRVSVVDFAMSGCPCSAQFASDFEKRVLAVPELANIVEFTSPFVANWTLENKKEGPGCFHGKQECEYEKWLLCAQAQSTSRYDWLNFELCADGPCDGDFAKMEPCKSQYVNPKNATLLQTCAARTGFDYSALEQCATGPAGVAALQKSADFYHGFRDSEGKSVAYGMQGLPVVLVNNKLVSKFWECSVKLETVIAAICEAFTGERPSVCAQEPPVDDEIAPVGGRVGRRLMAATRNAQAEDLERLEDKCHDPTYACENYGICCGNNGYRQPGRKAPCAEAKPFTKIGDCAAIKTHAGDF